MHLKIKYFHYILEKKSLKVKMKMKMKMKIKIKMKTVLLVSFKSYSLKEKKK